MSEEKDTAASPEETPAVEKTTAVEPKDESPNPVKPKDYVLVQHLQRYAESRGLRASRGGHRRQGVLLDDGTRIRQKAYRFTEMAISTLVANHQSILEHVREGRLAVFDPSGTKEATYEDLVSFVRGHMGGKKVEEKPLKEAIQEQVSGVKDEEVHPPTSTDITKPDGALSATLAAVDMAEENKKLAEAGSPDQPEEGEELTEEDLLKKTRAELNKIAKDYGVKHPEKMDSKQAVVEAIFSAAEKE